MTKADLYHLSTPRIPILTMSKLTTTTTTTTSRKWRACFVG